MEWIKVKTYWDIKTGHHEANLPFEPLLVSNGQWVEYIEEHGWDKQTYYFHNGNGKLENVIYFMPLPKPPKKIK